MIDVLITIHQWFGYALAVVVLVISLMAFGRAKDAREYTPGPYALGMVLIDIQVLIGLIQYGMGEYWDARPEIAYLHPALALVALVIGHAMLRRARREQMAVVAHRTAGRGLMTALVLVVAAIVVATVPPFL